jgi:N6-L-threonylcarbamoyladenine synthase
MKILAIETSCDETAVSIISAEEGQISVLSNIISSQVPLHAQWGGVVPNLAAREHTKNIIPVLTQSLSEARCKKNDISLIAVTHGPGLIPALLSGVSVAKSLAFAWHKPLIGIHHIEGHIYANWISNPDISFPALALVVSGGHTQLVHMHDHCTYEIIGHTQDDAVGEAFDKVARILDLGYPGGPIISERAQIFDGQNSTNDIILPRPMINTPDYHFSFSGLKTAVLYLTQEYRMKNALSKDDPLPNDFINAVASAFQNAVVDVLTKKTLLAAQEYNVKSILLAGGVSANTQLRDSLQKKIAHTLPQICFHVPEQLHCLDNATMIAVAAYYRFMTLSHKKKDALSDNWKKLDAQANRSL